MADSGLSHSESPPRKPSSISKVKCNDGYSSRKSLLSHDRDEGIGSSTRNSPRSTPGSTSYSRYGIPINPQISPVNQMCYFCGGYLSNVPLHRTNTVSPSFWIQTEVSKFTKHLLGQIKVEHLDETTSQISKAFQKALQDYKTTVRQRTSPNLVAITDNSDLISCHPCEEAIDEHASKLVRHA